MSGSASSGGKPPPGRPRPPASPPTRCGAASTAPAAPLPTRLAYFDPPRLLRDKIDGIPQIDAVSLIDRDGNLVNFSRFWPIPKLNVADRDYFKAMKAAPTGEAFITDPVENRGTGPWTIYLGRRLDGPNGEFAGLILGAMELRYFEDF